jgi:hypothetical protein
MRLVYRPSIDNQDQPCWDLIDKDNGNVTVACDVEDEYQSLLLAAPDLLEACKRTLAALQRHAPEYWTTDVQRLEAAIAQAEGRP